MDLIISRHEIPRSLQQDTCFFGSQAQREGQGDLIGQRCSRGVAEPFLSQRSISHPLMTLPCITISPFPPQDIISALAAYNKKLADQLHLQNKKLECLSSAVQATHRSINASRDEAQVAGFVGLMQYATIILHFFLQIVYRR